ncbi:MAG: ATP synthase F1 subunit delta [Planctomycetes bacterium]|nr:ATP synthase F1 subunit delta [Planctomycetota bacterium]
MPRAAQFAPAATRYGQALYGAAKSQSALDAVQSDMSLIQEVLRSEVGQALTDPRWSTAAKLEAITKAFSTGLHALTADLIKVLAQRERFELLPQLPAVFSALLDEHNGILRGQLEAASAVSDETLAAVEASLSQKTAKKVVLSASIDESLLGGICVTLAGIRYDGSALGKLTRLRSRLETVEL